MDLSEVKVGDVITYNDGSQRQVSFIENIVNIDKIIKVERPAYNTIYERKDILDKEEKEYLGTLVKPFKTRTLFIQKRKADYNEFYISIILIHDYINLPNFKANTMYKKMEPNKLYTLEELGL